MDGASGVLVIILAVVLAVFLILAVILMVLLIRVTQQIKHITESAERTVHQVENAASNVSRFTTPMTAVKMLRKVIKKKK